RVSTATVRRMIERRLLPATQPVLYAPWTIREEDLATAAVQRAIETVRSGGALPRSGESAQLALEDSSTWALCRWIGWTEEDDILAVLDEVTAAEGMDLVIVEGWM